MARSHARLKVSIHRDADWLARSPEAKLTYYTLLSDPRLTIAGVMETAERRWSRMTGYPLPTVMAALVELEEHDYIVVDGSTDELLIRTLARHDLDPNRINQNLAKGFWGAWGVVESAILRSVIVHGLDEDLWDRLAAHAPRDAQETRRSARLEPERHYPVGTGTSEVEDAPVATPPSSLLSPSTSRQPADERRCVLEAAANVIGERAAARPSTQNPAAVAAAVARGVIRDRYQDAYRFLAADPALTAQELADLLEPPEEPKTHPLDGMALAQTVMAGRNQRRINGDACGLCDDQGVFLNEAGEAVRCDCTKATA